MQTARTPETLGLAAALACGACFALACSDSDRGTAPSGPTMGASASSDPSADSGLADLSGLPPENRSPRIVDARLVPPRPAAGQQVRVEIDAEDADGDSVLFTYQWSLRGRAIPGATSERTVLRGARKGDMVSVLVTASDGLSRGDTRELKVRIGNREPEIDGIVFEPPGEMIAGRKLHARALAKDPDGDRLEFDYRWLVNGSDKGDGSADFSTEGLRRGDRLQVAVRASDGDTRSEEFETPVFELTNAPPVIDFEAIPPSPDGGLSYRMQATDPDGDRLRYRLREAPEGMTIVATRGEIDWIPRNDQIGTFTVVVEVDDLHGGITEQTFTMTVGGDGSQPAAPRR